MADGAGQDIERDRERKAEAQKAADHHQHQLEPVDPPPFQVALSLQDQFVGDRHRQNNPWQVFPSLRGAQRRSNPFFVIPGREAKRNEPGIHTPDGGYGFPDAQLRI
jgi:hypothetical protein